MKILIKNVIRTFMLSLFMIVANTLIAQQSPYHIINGVLKDSKTGEKISFASISVPNTGIGTVSNSDGEFILKVGNSVKAEYFEVTHLSYTTGRFKISETTEGVKVYFLDVQPVQLKEISVIPADARGIVEMAFRKIRENYAEIPNMMTGFYRESIIQRHDFLSVSEAVLDIYKAPYSGFQNDQVKIFRGRKSSDVKQADTLMVRLQGGPYVLLLLDIVKNTDLSIALNDLNNYRFEFGTVVNIDGQQHWVINFSPAVMKEEPLYFGKLYISANNMAIARAEFNLDLQDIGKATTAFIKKKPGGMIFVPVSTSYLVTYKEDNGKYYLNYVRVDLKFRCDWKKKLFKNSYSLMSEMAITGRSEDHIVKFQNDELFRSNMIFTENVEDFTDTDFWGEHNIIEPEQSIENAIQKLNRKK